MQKSFREYATIQLPGSGPEEWILRQREQKEPSQDWSCFLGIDEVLEYFRGKWGQYARECGLIVPTDHYQQFARGAVFQRLQMLDPEKEVACFYETSSSRLSDKKYRHIIILPLILSEDEFYGTLINVNNLSLSNAKEEDASKIFLYCWGYSENRALAQRARYHMCTAFEQAMAEPVTA